MNLVSWMSEVSSLEFWILRHRIHGKDKVLDTSQRVARLRLRRDPASLENIQWHGSTK